MFKSIAKSCTYVLFTLCCFSLLSAFIQTDNHLTYIGDGRDFNGIPVEVRILISTVIHQM
jgi:hypothetical protein